MLSLSRGYRLISGLCAAVIIVAVLLCFISVNNVGNSFAFTSSNVGLGAVDIGNILLGGYEDRTDGKVFDSEAMSALYAKLTGDSTKTDISDVDKLGTLNAAEIRANNGNKDIVLTMNGQQWTVTYLTNDSSGNTIVTLWQANSSARYQWNKWSDNSTKLTYPSNVYGTSYVRSQGLNIGSDYVSSRYAANLTKSSQSSTHEYAKLTMPSVSGALTGFIVKPSAVGYQSDQNQNAGGDRKSVV